MLSALMPTLGAWFFICQNKRAASISVLLGTQPTKVHSPPSLASRSTSATEAPETRAIRAAVIPAVPPPTTRTSKRVVAMSPSAHPDGRDDDPLAAPPVSPGVYERGPACGSWWRQGQGLPGHDHPALEV